MKGMCMYMQKVIVLIGWEKWREITGQEDQEMGYILGFGNGVPLNIVEESKVYLKKIWNKRMKKPGI